MLKKLWAKYCNMSPATKAGIWFTLCNIFQRGIQFLTTPLYTRLLSTEEYGMYSVFTTWLNIFSVFATLNLSSGPYYNGLLKYEQNRYDYTSSIQFMGNIFTIGFGALIVFLYPLIHNFIGIPLHTIFLMVVVMLFQPAYLFWSMQQRLDYKYRQLIFTTIIISAMTPIVGIFLIYYFNIGYIGVIIGYVVSNATVGLFFYVMNIIESCTFYNKEYWSYSLKLSLPLIPHYLSQMLLGQSDRIMIKYYCNASEAGIYSLAYQVSLIMNLFISGINNSLNPWMYRCMKDKKYNDIKSVSNKLIGAVIALSAIAMLISPEIILILGTTEYMNAIWIIPPIMFSTCITFCYCMWGTIIFYFENTKSIAVATSSGAILNLILNMFLIPKFGFIAAAYTTLVGYIAIAVCYYFFTKNVCKKNKVNMDEIFDIKKELLLLFILMIIQCFALIIYNFHAIIRYGILFMLCIVAFLNRKKLIQLIKTYVK